jgi:hypothetical protein
MVIPGVLFAADKAFIRVVFHIDILSRLSFTLKMNP